MNDVETEVTRREVKNLEEQARLSLYNEKQNRSKVIQKFQTEMAQNYQDK